MNLTPRLTQIIIVMLKEDRVMAVKELAEKIGVSKRTVQRELEYMGHELKAYNIQFGSRTGKGVWLEGSSEDKKLLYAQLMQGDNYDVSNREDRRKRLILEILKEKGLKKLFYYASQFQVSEATISSDLEAIEGWLNAQHLVITRKPGSGIAVVGNEENYRRAIRTFIEENIDTGLIHEFYEESDQSHKDMLSACGSGIGQVLKEDILRRVIMCMNEMQDKRIMTLTENSYTGLVLHIAIAINRILQNEIIEQNETWQDQVPHDDDYALAQAIVTQLSEAFAITIPDIETAYVCLHIKGAKHQNIEWHGENDFKFQRKELLGLVNEMIDAYDKDYAVLLKQDNEFIQGLLAHLQPTFIRLINDMKIANPVLSDIQTSYPVEYQKSERAAAVLEKWIKKVVPPEEIGFLTIHFGAAQVRLEGKRENIRQVSVGIICASGIGISRLMLSKLDKVFRDRVSLETYGQNDVTPYIVAKTDFFVSSLQLKNVDFDVVYVNPLISDGDLELVRQRIFQYERLPKKQKEETKFTLELEQVNILAMQIKTIIQYMDVIRVSNDVNFDELVRAIAEKVTPYSHQQDVIEEDIEAREKLASQIFAEFGFALLHTRTKGVSRPVFHVFMTKDKQAFTHPYFKGIGIVLVMLLPVDDHIKINSEILGYISSMLIEDYDFLTVIGGGDTEEIRSVLSKHLKAFFNQYINRIA